MDRKEETYWKGWKWNVRPIKESDIRISYVLSTSGCGIFGTLFYLITVGSHFPTALLTYKTMRLLDIMRVCEPKENIPS